MKKQLNLIVGLIVLFSMLLGACAPAAAPTQAPAEAAAPTEVPAASEPTKAPEAPAATEAPAEPAAPVNSTVDKPLIVSGPSDIPSLDPHTFNGMFQRSIGYWIFDVLVMNSQDGKGSNPELATDMDSRGSQHMGI